MYSPEHVAKIQPFVFVHNSKNMFFSIFLIFLDIHQPDYLKNRGFCFLITLCKSLYNRCYKMISKANKNKNVNNKSSIRLSVIQMNDT